MARVELTVLLNFDNSKGNSLTTRGGPSNVTPSTPGAPSLYVLLLGVAGRLRRASFLSSLPAYPNTGAFFVVG